jgi:hypothetical protein
MKFKNLLLLVALFSAMSSFGQYKSVVYDLEKNYFDQGQELPIESFIMLSGGLPIGIEMVQVNVHRSGQLLCEPLSTSKWKKTESGQRQYEMPINYKLKQNSDYGFVIEYYYPITQNERQTLFEDLNSLVMSYIDQSFVIKGNSVSTYKKDKKIQASLEGIVLDGTRFYQNDLDYAFPGFSEIVAERIELMADLSLKDNKFYDFKSKKEDDFSKEEQNFGYYTQRIDELKSMMRAELAAYLNTINYVLAERKTISSYPTEKGQYILPVNLGYGGIYNSGDLADLSYGSSPYVGLAFPLANSALKSNILSNMSVSFGMYFQGFDDENGVYVSGPLIDKPLFLGLGTRAFKLVRINAGVTALQKDPDVNNVNISEIYFRPSVNISLEIGLWLGLTK